MEKYFELQYVISVVTLWILGIVFAIPVVMIIVAKIFGFFAKFKRKGRKRRKQ